MVNEKCPSRAIVCKKKRNQFWATTSLSFPQGSSVVRISQKGLGASLLQGGKPVAYPRRTPTETEQRYAQIEKEMLAIVFLLEKFNQYTFGRRIDVYSDHKPPETILKKPLAVAPQRLQGMMKRLQKSNFDVICEHVKNMHIADMLYRVYLPTAGDYEDREF